MLHKMRKILLDVLIAIMLICGISVTANAAENGKTRTVKIGCAESIGYYMQDDDGNISGYGYDYEKILSQYTGWKVEYVYGTWAELNEKAAKGEIDLLGFMIQTKERQEKLDFADMSSGVSTSCLVTKKDNDTYAYEDYDSFDGMTIGYQKADGNLEDFRKWCELHSFTVNLIEYKSDTEVFDALNTEEIDAGMVTNYSNLENYNIIAKLFPKDFYYAVSKGHEEILNELNLALKELDTYYPDIEEMLYEDFYDKLNGQKTAFTEEEKAYLETNPVVSVFPGGREAPFEKYNDDTHQYEGIIPDVVDKLADLTGITFQYVNTNDRWAIKDSKSKGNKLTVFTNDFDWAKKNEMEITQPFVEAQISIISRQAGDRIKKVALIDNRYINYMTKKMHPDWKVKGYESLEGCIKAVQNGECDATVVNSFEADYFLSIGRYSMLHEEISSVADQKLCFAVSPESDEMLRIILSKALLMIPQDTYDTIVSQNIKKARSNTIIDLIYTNPAQVAFVFICILVLLILTIVFFVRTRISYRLIRQMSTEDPVTELQNRNVYEEKLENERKKLFKRIGCIYIDANGLHELNNINGHAAGDIMLQYLAKSLKAVFSYKEIFRVGGDEFVVICENVTEEYCNDKIQKVIELVEENAYSISVGLEFREEECGLDRTIQAADDKMLENKKAFYRHNDRRQRR